MRIQILLYSIMNTKIKRIFQVFIFICITLFAYMYVKKSLDLNDSNKKIKLLSSYVTYSIDMLKQISIEDISSVTFPKKDALIYCFSECIYQDLVELYEIQKEIGQDRILLLPVYRMSRINQIVYKNKLHNFKYINIPIDSIKFPFHKESGLEQRFFVYTDRTGGIRSLFFPQKNKQSITRVYLNGVRKQMK